MKKILKNLIEGLIAPAILAVGFACGGCDSDKAIGTEELEARVVNKEKKVVCAPLRSVSRIYVKFDKSLIVKDYSCGGFPLSWLKMSGDPNIFGIDVNSAMYDNVNTNDRATFYADIHKSGHKYIKKMELYTEEK